MTSREGQRWDGRPLSDVIEHIVSTYHDTTRSRLPELVSLAQHLVAEGTGSERSGLRRLADLLVGFAADLRAHMTKEESVLFPLIASGAGPAAFQAVQAMVLEHADALVVLDRIRLLTREFRPPTGASTSRAELYEGLRSLDDDLRRHMDLENEVLFPRALHGDG